MNPSIISRLWMVLITLLLHLNASVGHAASLALDVSQTLQDAVLLPEYLEVLEDPGKTLTLDEVRSPAYAARFKGGNPATEDLNYGYARAAYWLRLHLRNTGTQPIERMLEIGNWGLEYVDLYQPLPDGSYQVSKTGSMREFSSRPHPNRNFVFPLRLPPQFNGVLYVRVQSVPSIVVAKLWEPQAFLIYERNDYIAQAAYYGLAAGMILFNLLLFIALRDRIYILYVLFVSCMAITFIETSGWGKQFFWHDLPFWTSIGTNTCYSLSLASALIFARRMLHTRQLLPRTDKLMLYGAYLLAFSVLMFAIFRQYAAQVFEYIYLLVVLLILYVSVQCARLGQRSAYFFLAAFLALMTGSLLFSLRVMGILPAHFFTTNGLQMGAALEMVLLALALGDRFNQIRKQSVESKNEALQAKTQLVQSEKMAALGLLIAGVTHEINTPIGAIKSSGSNITDALNDALASLPSLFSALDAPTMVLFLRLVSRANEPKTVLSSREARAVTTQTMKQIEEAGIDNARRKAGIMVSLNAQAVLAEFIPLMLHPECDLILDTANNMAIIINSTNNINTAVDRVAKIVYALKSFSRVNEAAELTEASLNDGLETVLTIYQGQMKHGIELVRQYDDIAPIKCLPDELNQVWTNLIHNALQAMNHQGTLTIGVHRKENEAIVSVGDSGCGIPDEIRSKIFDVFFTTKAVGVGSGLGLDIVKKIIDKHKGRIDVQSQVGVGTTFTVYLPYT